MKPKPNVVLRPKRKMVAMSQWAHARLMTMLARLQNDARERPDLHPSLAGRRVTISDVICLMYERFHNAEN